MSASQLRQKWPHLTDSELLILSDPQSRHLCASYNITQKDIDRLFVVLPWARAILTPEAYYFRP